MTLSSASSLYLPLSPVNQAWSPSAASSPSPFTSDSEGVLADGSKKKRRSGFIETLFDIASSQSNGQVIGFSSDGIALEIRDTTKLSAEVLPKYFKHKNVSSFIRQLNNYGFRTIPSPKGVFQTFLHENFRSDQKDLIKLISRKGGSAPPKKKKTLYEQVVELKERVAERSEHIKDLESRDGEHTRYIKELEMQNRRLVEEREVLLLENMQLVTMLKSGEPGSQSGLPVTSNPQPANLTPLFEPITKGENQDQFDWISRFG